MKVLTVPRTAAALEYKALRLPAQVVEQRVVSRFLADDNAIRLGFERLLGTLDRQAGRLLCDEALTRRGDALIQRADVLARAVTLEQQAAATKEAADERLRAEKQAADERRAQARSERAQEARKARTADQAAKRRAAKKATSRVKAAAEAVDETVEATVSAEEERLQRAEESIKTRTSARTAAPKAQLEDAVEVTSEADRERQTAERLGDLADREKQERVQARGE
jgi:hypothetical protein